MKTILLTLIILLSSLSCSKGLNSSQLEQEITKKLNVHFQNKLFTLSDFSRRGSYSYTPMGQSASQLLLYFKTKLVLNKDYKFTDWDSLSVGSLTNILGSTPSGIEGIASEGNKKGDILTVYGTSNYKQGDNDSWISTNSPKSKNNKTTSTSKKYVSEIDASKKYDQNLPEYKKSLKILNQIFTTMSAQRDSITMQTAEYELKQVLAKANMYADIQKGVTTIATGSQAGNYYSIGNGIATLNTAKVKMKAYLTSGSVENCNLAQDKKVSFAIVQSNVAYMAYRGVEIFNDNMPMSDLRAVGAMYPEAMMIVTLKEANISSIYDLKGKVISIGQKGSGGHTDAISLIRAHKIKQKEFKKVIEVSFDISLKALRAKKIDAIFLTGSYPMASLDQLNEEMPISIVSINDEMIEKMTKRFPLIKIKIPRKTYKGQLENVYTVGATAMMVTHKDTSEKSVKNILNTMVGKNSELSKINTRANYITRRSLQRGITIPMHSGAKKYIRGR